MMNKDGCCYFETCVVCVLCIRKCVIPMDIEIFLSKNSNSIHCYLLISASRRLTNFITAKSKKIWVRIFVTDEKKTLKPYLPI